MRWSVCLWVACYSVFQKAETFLPWPVPRCGRFPSSDRCMSALACCPVDSFDKPLHAAAHHISLSCIKNLVRPVDPGLLRLLRHGCNVCHVWHSKQAIFFKDQLKKSGVACGTKSVMMCDMKTPPPKETTESHGVRLPVSYWLKLRSLMTYHGGRKWLEKAIDREAKKAGIEPAGR